MSEQSVATSETKPAPSESHRRAMLSTQVAWSGAHTPSSQVVVSESQYSPCSQLSTSVEPRPSESHSCTAAPLQKNSPGSQPCSTQVPFTQPCVGPQFWHCWGDPPVPAPLPPVASSPPKPALAPVPLPSFESPPDAPCG